jgi:hypothetical protein
MFALLVGLAFAQQDCTLTNYEPCKRENLIFLENTCNPLLATNRTHYNHCLCYHNVNLANCIEQCPNNSTAIAENSAVRNAVASLCAAVSLNPNALPNPPIWSTFTPTTSVAPVAPRNTAIAPPASTATSTPKSSALAGSSFAVLLGFVGLMV